MLGLERGDAHLIRNAGGLVTEDAIRSLSVSQRKLGTEEVVVVMHHGCGLHRASEDEFAQELAADGVLPAWRLGAFEDVEETLRQGLARLRSSPELPHRGHIRGFVFDPESGGLSEVDVTSKEGGGFTVVLLQTAKPRTGTRQLPPVRGIVTFVACRPTCRVPIGSRMNRSSCEPACVALNWPREV